jgi:hypothetical protein
VPRRLGRRNAASGAVFAAEIFCRRLTPRTRGGPGQGGVGGIGTHEGRWRQSEVREDDARDANDGGHSRASRRDDGSASRAAGRISGRSCASTRAGAAPCPWLFALAPEPRRTKPNED